MAQHILDTGHKVVVDDLKLVKAVSNNRELNSLESIFIHLNRDKLMNSDRGPIPSSPLFDLL